MQHMLMKTIVHVNQHHIKWNAKNEEKKPVFTIKQGGKTYYAREVEFRGPSRLVYKPDCKLACGAVAWIEADSKDVVMHDVTTFKELNS